MRKLFIGLTLLINYCNSFIVPQELPSILSLVYSNIPPIKKGTDSRLGFGFRLGEHADFQVQLELGPQKFTKPIGNGASDDEESSDTSKRMVNQLDYSKKTKPSNANGTQWLNNWAAEMKTKTKQKQHASQSSAMEQNPMRTLFGTENQYPIPTSPIIASSALEQLQQLYGKQNGNSGLDESNLGTLPAKSMAAHILAARQHEVRLKKQKIQADLMDVSLD